MLDGYQNSHIMCHYNREGDISEIHIHLTFQWDRCICHDVTLPATLWNCSSIVMNSDLNTKKVIVFSFYVIKLVFTQQVLWCHVIKGQNIRLGWTEPSLKQPLANVDTHLKTPPTWEVCPNCKQKFREHIGESWQHNHRGANESKSLIIKKDAESTMNK